MRVIGTFMTFNLEFMMWNRTSSHG